ncbi:hypothetical protein PR048_006248 [Dryococelus australis]|uniref:Uncharacterized protein n=1 Tax=Dryococelus australis TaxID=614101 RepID=A0ABQ9ICN1_9NEOP|nr:hypothetical protein PR048_006248 [Dryococelus australis]
MREETLVVHQQISDEMAAVGGIEGVVISKNMIHATRNTNSHYKEAVEDKKRSHTSNEHGAAKRKMNVLAIKELEAKKFKLMKEAERESEIID